MGAILRKTNSLSRTGATRRKKPAGGAALMSEINVTPFVDVMLVLLIIFMVTAPLLTAGVQVDLPEASSPPLAGQDEPLEVSVSKKGEIFLQETKLELEELTPKLEAIAGRKKDTRIFVRGDKAADYGKVIEVISTINNAGFTKVGLVTDEQKTPNKQKDVK